MVFLPTILSINTEQQDFGRVYEGFGLNRNPSLRIVCGSVNLLSASACVSPSLSRKVTWPYVFA